MDCLEGSKDIESGSVDLILTDLPYGTMNGFNGIDWDFAIDPKKVYEISNRILRKNGKLVLFSQEPYTFELMRGAIPNLLFCYKAIWEKDTFGNSLLINKAMAGMYEEILVFQKRDGDVKHPAWEYTNKIREYVGKPNKDIYNDFERSGYRKYALVDTFNSITAKRYMMPTGATYDALKSLYGIERMEGYKEYGELKRMDEEFKHKYKSVFNLWEGNKYKSNILKYKKDYTGHHPTQKPVLLLEDLIKTFSNEGDLVVDLTCGSGSTCLAALNTGRFFIGIEKEKEYVDIANKRIEEHQEKAR